MLLSQKDGEHLNGHHMGYPPVQQSEEQTGIRDVWAHNLREEFRSIRALVKQNYNYVAMVSWHHHHGRGFL